jgi:hypothetical protein
LHEGDKLSSNRGILRDSFPLVHEFFELGLIDSQDYLILTSSGSVNEIKDIFQKCLKLEINEEKEIIYFLFRVFPAKSKKEDWEDVCMTRKMQVLVNTIMDSKGVFSLKKLSQLCKISEKLMKTSLSVLVEMEIFQKIHLYNYEVLYVLHPKLMQEVKESGTK